MFVGSFYVCRQIPLPNWSEDQGVSGGVVKCLDIGKNTNNGESTLLRDER